MTTDKHRSTQIDKITEKIIACAYNVSNTLGCGFLEKVYENAMIIELRENGLFAEAQKPLRVIYKGQLIGEYYADLFVEEKVIVELKAVKQVENSHKAQLINYLNACNVQFGLILNFGNPKVEIRRIANGY